MGGMTRTELAERLHELKHMNVPRASLARTGGAFELRDGATWEGAIASVVLHNATDEYLRHFAWLANPEREGETLCPGCMTQGWFGWGITHGAGSCSCGWPGRLYHFIPDPDPDAACRYCEQPKSAHHYEHGSVGVLTPEGEARTEKHTWLRCPPEHAKSPLDDYRPGDAIRFTLLLWSHPYEVALTKQRSKA